MGKFAVPDDRGIGILLSQIPQEFIHGLLLCQSTGVICVALDIQSAFVADAERTVVEMPGVGSHDILWQNRNDFTVHTDVVVVTGLAEAGNARVDQVLHAERTADFRG